MSPSRWTLLAVLACLAGACASVQRSPSSADALSARRSIAPACYADARLTIELDTAASTRRPGGARNARVVYADSLDAPGYAPDFATFWTAAGDSVDVVWTDGQMGTAWRLAVRGDTLSGVWSVFGDVPYPNAPSWPVRLVRVTCGSQPGG